MWAKGRFSHMAEFAAKAKELGFIHLEANASIFPRMISELLESTVPISSIHSPCPAVLSTRGISASSLSLSPLDESERIEVVSFTKQTIDLASNVSAKAIVLHMGEVPIDLSLQDRLYTFCTKSNTQTKEYIQAKEEFVYQLISQVHPYLEVQQQIGFSSHGEWLLWFKHRMSGTHLHDVLGLSDHQAPGKGDVNWEMLTTYLPPGIVKVCEIGEWNDEDQIQGVVNFLQKEGIAG